MLMAHLEISRIKKELPRLKSLPSGNNAKFFSADMAEISSLDNPLINSDAAIICCLIPTYKGFDGTPAKRA